MRPPPTRTGSWKSRQRSAQSSGISVVSISTRPSPAAASRSGSPGTSPGGPVDRVLDVGLAALLLDAAGNELEQLGEHLLGQSRCAAHREPDQARPPLADRGSSEGALDAIEDALAGASRRVARLKQCSRRSARSRCSSLRSTGVITLITWWRSPRRPTSRSEGRPSPRIRIESPCWEPALTRSPVTLERRHRDRPPSIAGSPSLDHADSPRPGAESARRRRRARGRRGPRRRAGAHPACPAPPTRIRCPARFRRERRRRRLALEPRPSPPQTSQGFSGTLPSPWHVGQTAARTIWPKAVRVTPGGPARRRRRSRRCRSACRARRRCRGSARSGRRPRRRPPA